MHPYQTLPTKAFWAPSVAAKHMLDIEDLWQAPYAVTQKSRIATYGSCFAQHFSKALVARGFTWVNAEPAPAGLAPEDAQRFNYGVFSARTGNIYTTSLLRQWVEWAVGKKKPPKVFWEKDGRIYDPFRPAIEPGGFGSVDEMLRSRATCLDAFHKSITRCGIFVFTLGLTESWWDKRGGYEYPMCPGTHAGTFDPAQHVFLNQDYGFVRENLIEALSLISVHREKGFRILLTVSPVPLTATNSGNHVLVATMESKSILRAVAGDVARAVPNSSYFPSYEIINSPAYRGSFFEPNLRSVNHHGVAHVMETFFAGIAQREAAAIPNRETPKRKRKGNDPANGRSDDVKCEEELLATFGAESAE